MRVIFSGFSSPIGNKSAMPRSTAPCPHCLIASSGCWVWLVQEGNGISRFHEPPRELKSHLFVVLLDVSLRKLILITYLFLELQFLLLIGIRKGKLNFLLMTCKLQQKLAISNFLANQVHLFHAFPKLFYLTSCVLNFYHLVSYICVLIIKIAINLAILYLESIHLTMRRKKHAYELIEPERGVVDI